MNLQALAAMDDCEHATGKTLEQHVGRMTAKEAIVAAMDEASVKVYSADELEAMALTVLSGLRRAGYQIVQVVSTGNKPFG